MAAKEIARASFDEVVELIRDRSGAAVAKRQVQELVMRAATDFDAFYVGREPQRDEASTLLVLSTDGKGIVMRHEDLRSATQRAAEQKANKLETRLSPGEKADRKRMAQVIRQAFEEAKRRDPEKQRRWVVSVDGEPRQLAAVKAEAKRVGVKVTILLDVVHVFEHLWLAARALFGSSTPRAESWVGDRLLALLSGRSGGDVAATIRWWAKKSDAPLDAAAHKAIKKAYGYLAERNRTRLMNYAGALRDGLPIATGVIEGACRYLVKDRMDRTGACWSLRGAEAVLRLRALRASGDFDEYWKYHLTAEKQRNHRARYAGDLPEPLPASNRHLRRVK